jgi:dimethylpropiothetin dethiomethylase
MAFENTLNEHWKAFLPLICARLESSPSGIGASIIPLLLPLAGSQPNWSQEPPSMSLEASINGIHEADLRTAIKAMAPSMVWVEKGFFSIGEQVNRAYVELVGPDGMVLHPDFRCGLYWQQAHSLYPKHRHNAKELYHILSGTALWQRGDAEFETHKPGVSLEHLDGVDHATQTLNEDLLAFWAWRGDLGMDSYSMDV